jgi:epsilon-lactone hydrolase
MDIEGMEKKPWLELMNDNPSFRGRMISAMRFRINLEDYAKIRSRSGPMARIPPPRSIRLQSMAVNGVPCEWIRPKNAGENSVILCIHGGGFVVGGGGYCRYIGIRAAKGTCMQVLAPDYRLAPEHPFPAALDDCRGAYEGLLQKGFKPENIVIMGDSAGGNLCLALTLKLKDEKMPLPAAVVALSPATDFTSSGESWAANASRDPLFGGGNVDILPLYAKGHDPHDPYLSPYFGDFTGFPPTMICVGENEILLSDSLMVGEKAYRQGADIRVQLWKGMFHVFPAIPLPESKKAWKEISDFIHSKLAAED